MLKSIVFVAMMAIGSVVNAQEWYSVPQRPTSPVIINPAQPEYAATFLHIHRWENTQNNLVVPPAGPGWYWNPSVNNWQRDYPQMYSRPQYCVPQYTVPQTQYYVPQQQYYCR